MCHLLQRHSWKKEKDQSAASSSLHSSHQRQDKATSKTLNRNSLSTIPFKTLKIGREGFLENTRSSDKPQEMGVKKPWEAITARKSKGVSALDRLTEVTEVGINKR
eukprot:c18644_g1_i1 orf=75-392(+)